ncbi:hypothetical protein C8F01DRAFT_1256289 [Mycena amicta]|nr:hypothetical protein C8F01DRAFT_1256289 [Mycena amicta]
MPGPGIVFIFGPMLIGLILNVLLYGVMTTQMFTYYRKYTQDPRWIRYFMLYLLILETAVVVIQCGIVFQPLILEYGTPQAVINFPTLLPGDALTIALVSGPIQVFTAWRIKVISASYILPACICFLSLASFSLGLTSGVRVFLAGKFTNFAQLTSTTTAWLITTAVCDIVIAGGMTWSLLSRKTGFKHVDGQINRIVKLSVETGSITAAVAILDLALAIGIPNKAVSKLYRGFSALNAVYLFCTRTAKFARIEQPPTPFFTRPRAWREERACVVFLLGAEDDNGDGAVLCAGELEHER